MKWKNIPGYPGFQLSKEGKIRRIFKQNIQTTKDGKYQRVRVKRKDGTIEKKNLHRLMCLTFKGKPKKGQVAMHLDNDGLNNREENLKWGTQSENVKQAYREGRMVSPMKGKFGELNPTSKTIKVTFPDGREEVIKGIRAACRITGFKPQAISRVLRKIRNRKSHKGHLFSYTKEV